MLGCETPHTREDGKKKPKRKSSPPSRSSRRDGKRLSHPVMYNISSGWDEGSHIMAPALMAWGWLIVMGMLSVWRLLYDCAPMVVGKPLDIGGVLWATALSEAVT